MALLLLSGCLLISTFSTDPLLRLDAWYSPLVLRRRKCSCPDTAELDGQQILTRSDLQQNGTKLGEIPLANAAIGRQSSRAADAGEDAYLHAFLIRTQNDKEQDADHILCAENDEARDEWVQALTTLQPVKSTPTTARPTGGSVSFDRERIQTSNIPMTASTPPPIMNDERRPSHQSQSQSRRQSGSAASGPPPQDPRNLSTRQAGSDMAPSASMPANLDAMARGNYPDPEKRSNSAQGHHQEQRTPAKLQAAPERRRPSAQLDRPSSPERERRSANDSASKFVASNVSGPMNAQPLPSGYEFKKAERQKKTKSSFWNFGARSESAFVVVDRWKLISSFCRYQ